MCVGELSVSKLCVGELCARELRVTGLCVRELCVSKLCVRELCVRELCVRELAGHGRTAEGADGRAQPKTRTPPTQRCGEKRQRHLRSTFAVVARSTLASQKC